MTHPNVRLSRLLRLPLVEDTNVDDTNNDTDQITLTRVNQV